MPIYYYNYNTSDLQEVYLALGWGLDKKRLSINSGILRAQTDMYRRLFVPKNGGPNFIKILGAAASKASIYGQKSKTSEWPQNEILL